MKAIRGAKVDVSNQIKDPTLCTLHLTCLYKTHGYSPQLLVRSIGFLSVLDSLTNGTSQGNLLLYKECCKASGCLWLPLRTLGPCRQPTHLTTSKCYDDINAEPQFPLRDINPRQRLAGVHQSTFARVTVTHFPSEQINKSISIHVWKTLWLHLFWSQLLKLTIKATNQFWGKFLLKVMHYKLLKKVTNYIT